MAARFFMAQLSRQAVFLPVGVARVTIYDPVALAKIRQKVVNGPLLLPAPSGVVSL
jgi:hypothetical protein